MEYIFRVGMRILSPNTIAIRLSFCRLHVCAETAVPLRTAQHRYRLAVATLAALGCKQ